MNNFAEDNRFNRVASVILGIMVFATLLPIVLIVIASFTNEQALIANGYSFLPKKLSTDAYYYMIKQGTTIFRAYGVSLLTTAIGLVTSVLITTMLAYPMARRTFKYRNALAFFVFFTMLFNGGIVSSYIMWSNLFNIKNTIWALIVPNYLVTAFNVFLVRNYYANSIPEAILEAAQIDGLNEIKTFIRIVLPLSVPTIATISLFTGLIYWNDWVNGLYYVTDAKLFNIQLLLIKIMNNVQFLKSGAANIVGNTSVELPGTSVRMAMAVIGILPILILYPFVQKYFIKGVIVGGVKG